MKISKLVLVVCVGLLCNVCAVAQTLQELPSVGGFYWGMSYSSVLERIDKMNLNYDKFEGDDNNYVVCEDYNIFNYSIGLNKGYETYFVFNKFNRFVSVLVMMTPEHLENVLSSGDDNIITFLGLTNLDWQLLRQRFGEETSKSSVDVSSPLVQQAIVWTFEGGVLWLWREYRETFFGRGKDFVFYIQMDCRVCN